MAATMNQVTTNATTERAGDIVLLLHWIQSTQIFRYIRAVSVPSRYLDMYILYIFLCTHAAAAYPLLWLV